MPGRPGPFTAARLAGRLLWRRPLAPLLLALLLLGWQSVLSGVTAPLLWRLARAAWAGESLLPAATSLAAVALSWHALLTPLIGLGLALVEAGPAGALSRGVSSLAGLGTVGLAAGLAGGASQGCLTAALLAAGQRHLGGGGPLGSALLWALPAAPALLLGALASGAALLATARIAAGRERARTPWEGLRALGQAVTDLLAEPVRSGSAFSALLLVGFPFTLGAVLLATAGWVVRPPAARAALSLGAALAAAASLLWLAVGLRLALEPSEPPGSSSEEPG